MKLLNYTSAELDAVPSIYSSEYQFIDCKYVYIQSKQLGNTMTFCYRNMQSIDECYCFYTDTGENLWCICQEL